MGMTLWLNILSPCLTRILRKYLFNVLCLIQNELTKGAGGNFVSPESLFCAISRNLNPHGDGKWIKMSPKSQDDCSAYKMAKRVTSRTWPLMISRIFGLFAATICCWRKIIVLWTGQSMRYSWIPRYSCIRFHWSFFNRESKEKW